MEQLDLQDHKVYKVFLEMMVLREQLALLVYKVYKVIRDMM